MEETATWTCSEASSGGQKWLGPGSLAVQIVLASSAGLLGLFLLFKGILQENDNPEGSVQVVSFSCISKELSLI